IPPPSPLTPLSSPLPQIPSPSLPASPYILLIPLPAESPPLQLLSSDRRADRPEVTLPPRKRLSIVHRPGYEAGESSVAAAARPIEGCRADYGFKIAPKRAAPRRTTRLNPGATSDPNQAPSTTTTTITNAQLQAMIDQGVNAALAARDANRTGDDSHTSGTGMDRLLNQKAVIVCYENIVRIPIEGGKIEKVLSDLEARSSSADEKIYEVSYYLSESKSEYEFETSEYYDNFTNYGLFVNNNDDQEIFHDAIKYASENFIENHIDSQKDYDKSDVDHNDSEEKDHLVDKLIRKFNKKIAKCQDRVEKAN
nr:hypothetical protein [Tanacetum cinerariifolium]